jgi:hypothetical protein
LQSRLVVSRLIGLHPIVVVAIIIIVVVFTLGGTVLVGRARYMLKKLEL